MTHLVACEDFMALEATPGSRIARAQQIWALRSDGRSWHAIATALDATVATVTTVALYPFGTSRPRHDDPRHYARF